MENPFNKNVTQIQTQLMRDSGLKSDKTKQNKNFKLFKKL